MCLLYEYSLKHLSHLPLAAYIAAILSTSALFLQIDIYSSAYDQLLSYTPICDIGRVGLYKKYVPGLNIS